MLTGEGLDEVKLNEKLEKEKSKRKFCESKIIELQKDIINLEEVNHGLAAYFFFHLLGIQV